MMKDETKYTLSVGAKYRMFVAASAVATFGLTGCFNEPEQDPLVLEEVDNAYWCATIETAQADTDPTGEGPYPKTIVVDSKYPKHCECAPTDHVNNVILGLANNGEAVISETEEQAVKDFRDDLFAGAVADCVEMYETEFENDTPAPDLHTCDTQLVSGESPIYQEQGTCNLWREYDLETGDDGEDDGVPLPADHWSDYYTLTSVIVYNTGTQTYEIDEVFFNDLLDNPAWLLGDSAYVAHNGRDWQLYSVVSGDVAHRLGLQSGDLPQTLNTYDITTPEGVLIAYDALVNATSFTLVVKRSGSNVTLEYDVL